MSLLSLVLWHFVPVKAFSSMSKIPYSYKSLDQTDPHVKSAVNLVIVDCHLSSSGVCEGDQVKVADEQAFKWTHSFSTYCLSIALHFVFPLSLDFSLFLPVEISVGVSSPAAWNMHKHDNI